MKNPERILNAIRNHKLAPEKFRRESGVLAEHLVRKVLKKIPPRQHKDIIPIMIFRAGLVFLPPLLKLLPGSPIGFMGIKRNEKTAKAVQYYANIPRLNKNSVILICDPMLATAGTLTATRQVICRKFRRDSGRALAPLNTYFVGFLAAPEGIKIAHKSIPPENIVLLAVDIRLDKRKFIVPGLGDFGDRFFGN